MIIFLGQSLIDGLLERKKKHQTTACTQTGAAYVAHYTQIKAMRQALPQYPFTCLLNLFPGLFYEDVIPYMSSFQSLLFRYWQ